MTVGELKYVLSLYLNNQLVLFETDSTAPYAVQIVDTMPKRIRSELRNEPTLFPHSQYSFAAYDQEVLILQGQKHDSR